MIRGIRRVRRSIRGRLGGLCRRGRNVDLDISDRVPFDMVRVETMTRARKEDCNKSVQTRRLRIGELTILQYQRRSVGVHGCHGALHNCVGRILQGDCDRDTDETGRHGCGSALWCVVGMLFDERPPLRSLQGGGEGAGAHLRTNVWKVERRCSRQAAKPTPQRLLCMVVVMHVGSIQ